MRVLLAAPLALGIFTVLAGCGIAPSVHPLSDEETTVLDERLIGRWYGLKDDGGSEPKRPDLLYVGRRAPGEGELEAVWVELADERVRIQRFRVRTTKIGAHHYLSATAENLAKELLEGVEEVPKTMWLLLRYEVSGPDLLRLSLLDAALAGDAIRDGKLAGKIEIEEGTEADPKYESVLIEASTGELRKWAEANAEKAFPWEDAARLRRAEAPDEEDEPEEDE